MSDHTRNHTLAAARNYIQRLAEDLILYYQNAQPDRQRIASLSPRDNYEDFTLLEEIELLTVDIRGYASQVARYGQVNNQAEVIKKLEQMRVFELGCIAQWYFESGGDYGHLKLYVKMLDYLRYLVLEYLRLSQIPEFEQSVK